MPDFVQLMLSKYSPVSEPGVLAEQVVREFLEHFRCKHEASVAQGKQRQLSHLSSAQSALSRFKKRVEASADFKKGLHLSKEDALSLAREKAANLRKKSIDMESIDGDSTVEQCRELLDHAKPELRIIALACLTGRRMGEIVHSCRFGPPREPHRLPDYWTEVSGLLKQRGHTKSCEAPLFERRQRVVQALETLRKDLGPVAPSDVNRRFGSRVARAMKRFCPHIGNVHAFRKFYVLMANHYFNDRNCSIARLGSDILCHRDMNVAVLPYLNMSLHNVGSLRFEDEERKDDTAPRRRSTSRRKKRRSAD